MATKLDIDRIIQVDFPESQYYNESTEKKQIVLHHTVGGNVDGTISWWKTTTDRVGTAMIIEKNGDIYQIFSSKKWAHHLGLHTTNNVALNKSSIGIEIVNWGGLIKLNNDWYVAKWDDTQKKEIANTKIKPITEVELYPQGFMGYYGFEKYTNAQIESVRQLLEYWGDRYGIPLTYNTDMWNLSTKALSGSTGVWTHVSFRGNGKSDCHPQPELIEMLKSLK
jgi:N-acetyl-anhydromuramyl-L-alanine amidase AmpD